MARPEFPPLDFFLDERLFPTFDFDSEPFNRSEPKEPTRPLIDIAQLLQDLRSICRSRRFRLVATSAVFLLILYVLIPKKHRTYVEFPASPSQLLDSHV